MPAKKSFRGSLSKSGSAPRKTTSKSSSKRTFAPRSASPTPITERPSAPNANKKTTNKQISTAPKSVNTQISSAPKLTNTQISSAPKSISTEIMAAPKNALMSAALSRIAPVPATGPGVDRGSPGAETRPAARAPIQANSPEVVAPSNPVTTPAPQIVTGGNSGVGSGGGAFSTIGNSGRGATLGMLQRLRNSRGPRTGMSLTPELLQRLAAQRISRQ